MSHTLVTGLRAAAARRGPARDRPAVAQDVPGHAVLRARGRGDPGDGRDRPRALGHQGQGAAAAGLQAARRRLSQAGAGLRLEHVPVHRRGDRGAGEEGAGRRASPRSSSAGSRSARTRRPTAPISRRSARAVGDDMDLMLDVGLIWDAKTTLQRARLFEPYRLAWIEEPLHAGRPRGLRQGRGRHRHQDRGRRGGVHGRGLHPADGPRPDRRGPGRPDPLRPDPGDEDRRRSPSSAACR